MSRTLAPQPGFQTDFIRCPADVALGGGAAGGGKSFVMAMIPLAYINRPKFTAGFFREQLSFLKGPGSLIEETRGIYPLVGGRFNGTDLFWRFPSQAIVQFSHLSRYEQWEDFKSKSFTFLGIDEASRFNGPAAWQLYGRCRSMSGVRPFMRLTSNPDPDCWLYPLVEWYLDEEGYPDAEKTGKIRYFLRIGDVLEWDFDKTALEIKHKRHNEAQSFTFIPGFLEQNKALTMMDSSYAAKLGSLKEVEKLKLLRGNWKVRQERGELFNRSWLEPWVLGDAAMRHTLRKTVRGWDLAATPFPGDQWEHTNHRITAPVSETPPDWTVGVRIQVLRPRFGVDWVVDDVKRVRDNPGAVKDMIRRTAIEDGPDSIAVMQIEPGQAGEAQKHDYQMMFSSINRRIEFIRTNKSKAERARPVAAMASQRRIRIKDASWNAEFLSELTKFPDGAHDDQLDAFVMAGMHCLERYRNEEPGAEKKLNMDSFLGSMEDLDVDREEATLIDLLYQGRSGGLL